MSKCRCFGTTLLHKLACEYLYLEDVSRARRLCPCHYAVFIAFSSQTPLVGGSPNKSNSDRCGLLIL